MHVKLLQHNLSHAHKKRESIMSSAKVLEQNNVKENADGGQAVEPHDE